MPSYSFDLLPSPAGRKRIPRRFVRRHIRPKKRKISISAMKRLALDMRVPTAHRDNKRHHSNHSHPNGQKRDNEKFVHLSTDRITTVRLQDGCNYCNRSAPSGPGAAAHGQVVGSSLTAMSLPWCTPRKNAPQPKSNQSTTLPRTRNTQHVSLFNLVGRVPSRGVTSSRCNSCNLFNPFNSPPKPLTSPSPPPRVPDARSDRRTA